MEKELTAELSSHSVNSLNSSTAELLTDSYSDHCLPGKTIGTVSPSGTQRKGIDAENLIAIDNGALRFSPLLNPGWERQGIAYGPYTRTNGLAFVAFLLNGHNTSESSGIGQRFITRLIRWVRGSQTEAPIQRIWHWFGSKQKQGTLRRLRWWAKTRKGVSLPDFHDNLALGWFDKEVPSDPLREGNAFIIHGTGADNGELRLRVGENLLSTFKGLQNIQVYYIAILREKGTAYYGAAATNAWGLGSYPQMRLLGIDPFHDDPKVYAGIYQSVLGQVGFRVDTRVYAVNVQPITALATWYGTAHAADTLQRQGFIEGSQAEQGGLWEIYQGRYELTSQGAKAIASNSLAVLNPRDTSGLIHLLMEAPANCTAAGIVWRVEDEQNFWSLIVTADQCELQRIEAGIKTVVSVSDRVSVGINEINSLQISDDGDTFNLYLNGTQIFDSEFSDPRGKNATKVGIIALEANPNLYFHSFEAHPRTVLMPSELQLGMPGMALGTQIAIADDFSGTPRNLSGQATNIGDQIWQRDIGTGIIEITGNGSAKVQASRQNPNPGRTAYTVAWEQPKFADLEVEITPPGSQRGQREEGRGGLIFWQDAKNYIIINNWLNDYYGGASISSFFYLNGFEELYDAVWTNVGTRIGWGIPHKLRVIFDGLNYQAFVNDEPVLYRSLRDVYPEANSLVIHRIGIVANWEWGNDTGSIFKNFVARV